MKESQSKKSSLSNEDLMREMISDEMEEYFDELSDEEDDSMNLSGMNLRKSNRVKSSIRKFKD